MEEKKKTSDFTKAVAIIFGVLVVGVIIYVISSSTESTTSPIVTVPSENTYPNDSGSQG